MTWSMVLGPLSTPAFYLQLLLVGCARDMAFNSAKPGSLRHKSSTRLRLTPPGTASAYLQRASTGSALPMALPSPDYSRADDSPMESPTSPLALEEACQESRVRKVPTSHCYRPREISPQRTTSLGRKDPILSRRDVCVSATLRI